MAHPVVGAVMFAVGAVFGCKPPMPDGAPADRGIGGGMNSLQYLLMGYLFSLGIIPLVFSAFGAWIGVVVNSWRDDDSELPNS